MVGERAEWLRGLLIAEREARGWSLEQTARAIGREAGGGLSKQSLHAWESGAVNPKIDQFAAWAQALGLRLEIDLCRPGVDSVPVRLPARVAGIARDLSDLSNDDLRVVSELIGRLKRI